LGTIAASVSAAAILLVVLAYYERNASYMDFRAYYYGAQAFTRGERLYGPGLVWRDTGFTQFHPGREAPTENGTYIYPPAPALVFVPLTAMPYRLAGHVWLAVIFGCFLGAIYVLSGLLFPGSQLSRAALTLMASVSALTFHASRAQLGLGQADFVVLLLMTLMLAASIRGNEVRAGLWLSLMAALKPTTAFFILWFLWKRAYRAAAVSAILSAVLFGASLAIFGSATMADYLAVAQYFSGPVFSVTPINQSPYGLLLRLLTANPFTIPILVAPTLVEIFRFTLAILTLLILTKMISRSRTVPATQLALEFGLAAAGMLLIGPLSEDIHYVYLLISFVAVGTALMSTWRLSVATVALATVLVATYAYLSLPGMVDLLFAGDMRVPVPVSAPKSLLTGAMIYGLGALAIVNIIVLRRYRSALSREPAAGSVQP
jgi:hypothetical protein